MKNPKRPRDPNQLARLITGLATGDIVEKALDEGKNPAAVALGRKGGAARATALSKKRRSEIARQASAKRWEEN